MPNIESDFFAGKPVIVNNQEGFICENPTPGQGKRVIVKLKNQPMPSTIS